MPRNESVNSPLSRIAQEANRQKHGNDGRRISLISAVSVDSVATTGRLLDKLKLADNEWDDFERTTGVVSPVLDADTSTGSVVTVNSDSSVRVNTSGTSESTVNSINVLPASKFKYLKYVLGDTKKKNSQKSAVNKALEMGKKINTVEQNAARVTQRANVKSIHLDSLLQDAESSVSSFESESEREDDEDYGGSQEKQQGGYGASASEDSLPRDATPSGTELSFVPNTPTRRALDYTPANSPETHMHVTPQYSVGSTPKMHLLSHHNHTLSSLSTNSAKGDAINDSFIHNREHDDEHASNSSSVPYATPGGVGKDGFKEVPHFRQLLSTHQHTNSAATTDLSKPGLDPDFAADIDDSLMRSASVPIKRKKSVAEARTPAPKTPLPAPPIHLVADQSKHQVMSCSDLVDGRKEHISHARPQFSPQAHHHHHHHYNNNPAYQFPNHHQVQPQIPPSSPHRTSPQLYQNSPHSYNSSANNSGHGFTKRGPISSPSNQMHYAPSPQSYQHRNFNPQHGPYGPYARSTSHPKVPQVPYSQPGFYPQPQQQQPHYPRAYVMQPQQPQHQQHQQHPLQYPGANSPYYKTSQRHGYSPQTSPKVGYFNLASGNHPSMLDYEGRYAPSTPPSHMKKSMQLRDADLSHVVPR